MGNTTLIGIICQQLVSIHGRHLGQAVLHFGMQAGECEDTGGVSGQFAFCQTCGGIIGVQALLHLDHPQTISLPLLAHGKIFFHESGPWCQKWLGTAGLSHPVCVFVIVVLAN